MLQRIAIDYMDRIGFGDQPFLVYRHYDAQHPHIHIVTSTIRADNTAIDLHNIGRELSEPAREAIEQQYGLIPARGRRIHLDNLEGPHSLASKVQEVTGTYKFTSLDELNAILAKFSITAWTGTPGSALHSNRGLVYSRIDEAGNKIGTPIKSSNLATRPTLDWLEKRFEFNRTRLVACQQRVASKFTAALQGDPRNLAQRLQHRRFSLKTQRDNQGNLLRLHLVDHDNKAVFVPEDLGYSTDALWYDWASIGPRDSRPASPWANSTAPPAPPIDPTPGHPPKRPSALLKPPASFWARRRLPVQPATTPSKRKRKKEGPFNRELHS